MSDLVSANERSLIEDNNFDKPHAVSNKSVYNVILMYEFQVMILYVKNSDGSLLKEVATELYRNDANTKWLVKDRSILGKDIYINK